MGLCENAAGEEIVREFGVLQDHPREAVYNLCGNHDELRTRGWYADDEQVLKLSQPFTAG